MYNRMGCIFSFVVGLVFLGIVLSVIYVFAEYFTQLFGKYSIFVAYCFCGFLVVMLLSLQEKLTSNPWYKDPVTDGQGFDFYKMYIPMGSMENIEERLYSLKKNVHKLHQLIAEFSSWPVVLFFLLLMLRKIRHLKRKTHTALYAWLAAEMTVLPNFLFFILTVLLLYFAHNLHPQKPSLMLLCYLLILHILVKYFDHLLFKTKIPQKFRESRRKNVYLRFAQYIALDFLSLVFLISLIRLEIEKLSINFDVFSTTFLNIAKWPVLLSNSIITNNVSWLTSLEILAGFLLSANGLMTLFKFDEFKRQEKDLLSIAKNECLMGNYEQALLILGKVNNYNYLHAQIKIVSLLNVWSEISLDERVNSSLDTMTLYIETRSFENPEEKKFQSSLFLMEALLLHPIQPIRIYYVLRKVLDDALLLDLHFANLVISLIGFNLLPEKQWTLFYNSINKQNDYHLTKLVLSSHLDTSEKFHLLIKKFSATHPSEKIFKFYMEFLYLLRLKEYSPSDIMRILIAGAKFAVEIEDLVKLVKNDSTKIIIAGVLSNLQFVYRTSVITTNGTKGKNDNFLANNIEYLLKSVKNKDLYLRQITSIRFFNAKMERAKAFIRKPQK